MAICGFSNSDRCSCCAATGSHLENKAHADGSEYQFSMCQCDGNYAGDDQNGANGTGDGDPFNLAEKNRGND